ncbi:MAG: Arc family DNA-binding protein [Solirubrobacteraceae bacterium]
MVPVRLPPEMLDEIRQRADADDRSVSSWIRRVVDPRLCAPFLIEQCSHPLWTERCIPSHRFTRDEATRRRLPPGSGALTCRAHPNVDGSPGAHPGAGGLGRVRSRSDGRGSARYAQQPAALLWNGEARWRGARKLRRRLGRRGSLGRRRGVASLGCHDFRLAPLAGGPPAAGENGG